MNIKNNQRAHLTQKKIREVLLEKLNDKRNNQISVQEICRGANIHRTTFYSYYDNIDDLMNSIEIDMEEGINKIFLQPEIGTYKTFTEKSLEMLINYVRENSKFYRVYLNDFTYIRTFDKRISEVWKQEIEPVQNKDANLNDTELLYKFEYFNSGLHGVLRMWLNTNCQESSEELIKVLMNCINF